MQKPWDDDEYCAFRNISKSASAQERYKGTGPRFMRVGRRVYYDPADVYAWLEGHKVDRTDQRVASA